MRMDQAFTTRKALLCSTLFSRSQRDRSSRSHSPQVCPQCDCTVRERSSTTPARRPILQAMLALVAIPGRMPAHAETAIETNSNSSSGRGMNRYIKKKKLDALETYVPSVLQARLQLETAGRVMKQDAEGARTLLRKGAFTGLRDCVKALAEYATQSGLPQEQAAELLSKFLASLQSYDLLLARAVRDKTPVPDEADGKLSATVEDLDRLLGTVPREELDKAQRLLDRVQAVLAEPSSPADVSSKEAQTLEGLVPAS